MTLSGRGFHPLRFDVVTGSEVEIAMVSPFDTAWLALHVLDDRGIRVPPFHWIEPAPRCENPTEVVQPLSGMIGP